jgi:hypothetical protein
MHRFGGIERELVVAHVALVVDRQRHRDIVRQFGREAFLEGFGDLERDMADVEVVAAIGLNQPPQRPGEFGEPRIDKLDNAFKEKKRQTKREEYTTPAMRIRLIPVSQG